MFTSRGAVVEGNAINDAAKLEAALHDVDFEILEIPLNSNRLWKLVSGK